jgi:Domain of unknown function (DUF4399)
MEDMVRISWSALLLASLVLLPIAAVAQGLPTPKDASLYIISPKDGATISGPFWCIFGLRGMGISHAGDQFPNSGHHHLFVDVDEPLNPSEPIPQDKKHLHYGAGQTEALIQLSPGQHTLQLVLGDAKHFPFNPPLVSKKITITIKEPNAAKKMGEATLPRRTERRQCR